MARVPTWSPVMKILTPRIALEIVAHEGIVLLVRGNENWAAMPMATRAFNRRNAGRNAAMCSAMRGLCERMRVPYFERPVVPAGQLETVNGAGWHNNEEGERQLGQFDSEAMLVAWHAAQHVTSTTPT